MLRAITAEDADALFRIFGDPVLTRFWGHPALPDEAAADRLVAEIQAGAASGELLQWGIELDEASGLIGTCTLAAVDRTHRRAELGAALAPEVHGRGFAEEAARAVIRFGFEELDLHRITADVDPRNEAALVLARRLGFREEGRLREHHLQHGEWQDGVLFGLLASEFEPDPSVRQARGKPAQDGDQAPRESGRDREVDDPPPGGR